MNVSPLLDLDDHCKYQMLLGILQWFVIGSNPKLCTFIYSLKQFGSGPREYHLDLDVQAFGYIKTTLHQQIAIDSRLMLFNQSTPKYIKLVPDFIHNYHDASEESDPGFPLVFGPELQTTIFDYSDHAHDLKNLSFPHGCLNLCLQYPSHTVQ